MFQDHLNFFVNELFVSFAHFSTKYFLLKFLFLNFEPTTNLDKG